MLWDVRSKRDGGDGPWWTAPIGRQKEAYYRTLRVHYGMGAKQAWDYIRENGKKLSLDVSPGFMGLIRLAIHRVDS